MATFGILVGGGPAPGINGVIGAATIFARRHGSRVLGLLDGFRWLMEGNTEHVLDLHITEVSRIHLLGGSILRTSRANPTRNPQHLDNVVKALERLGVDHLITIGGDDTAFSASRVAENAAGRVRVVHVPKTIDNDLPLPHGTPTFGFETAREHGAHVVSRMMEDARTSQRWYFVVMMGRTAGHLALGAGKAAGATLTLIAEDFAEDPIRLETVARTLEGAIVKRAATRRPHGVAVIAEGIGARLDPNDLEILRDVARDEHGHIRLADVPLGRVLRDTVASALRELGLETSIVEKDVGYELRCAEPNSFDIDYTRDLGAGAVRMLLAGQSQVLITRQQGAIVPIPFKDLVDASTGRTRVRLVDTSSESHATAHALQVRLEAADLESDEWLGRIAKVANLTPEQARERYARVC